VLLRERYLRAASTATGPGSQVIDLAKSHLRVPARPRLRLGGCRPISKGGFFHHELRISPSSRPEPRNRFHNLRGNPSAHFRHISSSCTLRSLPANIHHFLHQMLGAMLRVRHVFTLFNHCAECCGSHRLDAPRCQTARHFTRRFDSNYYRSQTSNKSHRSTCLTATCRFSVA